MEQRALVNIGIARGVHAKLTDDAKECGGMKLHAMFSAYQRGWGLLTPEQQMQAIRCGEDSRVASALGDKPCNDLRTEVTRLVSDSAALNQFINEALSDGECDAKEKRRLRSLLKQILKRVDGAAQLAVA